MNPVSLHPAIGLETPVTSFAPRMQEIRLFGQLARYDNQVEWQNLADWDILGVHGCCAGTCGVSVDIKTFPLDLKNSKKRGSLWSLYASYGAKNRDKTLRSMQSCWPSSWSLWSELSV